MWQPLQPNNSIEIRHRALGWVNVQAEGDVPSERENHTFTYLGKSRVKFHYSITEGNFVWWDG